MQKKMKIAFNFIQRKLLSTNGHVSFQSFIYIFKNNFRIKTYPHVALSYFSSATILLWTFSISNCFKQLLRIPSYRHVIKLFNHSYIFGQWRCFYFFPIISFFVSLHLVSFYWIFFAPHPHPIPLAFSNPIPIKREYFSSFI